MKYVLAGVLFTIMTMTAAAGEVVCGKKFMTFETPNDGFMFPSSAFTVRKANVIRILLNVEDDDAFAIMTMKGDPGGEHGVGTAKLKDRVTWEQVVACLD